jgi:hypothetical protein
MERVIRDWPALMDLATAGDYLALTPGSLINLLRRENVSPVEIGGRLRRWRRRDLDALVERLPLRWAGPADAPADDEPDVESALKAVERRSQLRRRQVARRRAHEVRQPHPAP